jgi:hypothetical protein
VLCSRSDEPLHDQCGCAKSEHQGNDRVAEHLQRSYCRLIQTRLFRYRSHRVAIANRDNFVMVPCFYDRSNPGFIEFIALTCMFFWAIPQRWSWHGNRMNSDNSSLTHSPLSLTYLKTIAAIPNSKLLEAGTLDISFTSNLFEEP